MINVTTHILKFRDFLVHSWPDLDRIMENHDWDDDVGFTDDWLQVNWEFLVERELLVNKGFLKSYTNLSFRITHAAALATHEIICTPKTNKPLINDKTQLAIPEDTVVAFGGFVNKFEGWYGCYPPFDFLTVFKQNKRDYFHISVDSVDFYLCPVLA